MKMKQRASNAVAWRAESHCALFSKGGVTPAAAKAIVTPPAGSIMIARISHPSAIEQTAARYRISFSRSRQKRGPPVLLS